VKDTRGCDLGMGQTSMQLLFDRRVVGQMCIYHRRPQPILRKGPQGSFAADPRGGPSSEGRYLNQETAGAIQLL